MKKFSHLFSFNFVIESDEEELESKKVVEHLKRLVGDSEDLYVEAVDTEINDNLGEG